MIDSKTIIERGYSTNEEYKIMAESEKLNRIIIDNESVWIYALEPQNGKYHFVFHNNPVVFWGCPRSICGMVGIGAAGRAEVKDCIALFKKAGKPAIEYYNKTNKK